LLVEFIFSVHGRERTNESFYILHIDVSEDSLQCRSCKLFNQPTPIMPNNKKKRNNKNVPRIPSSRPLALVQPAPLVLQKMTALHPFRAERIVARCSLQVAADLEQRFQITSTLNFDRLKAAQQNDASYSRVSDTFNQGLAFSRQASNRRDVPVYALLWLAISMQAKGKAQMCLRFQAFDKSEQMAHFSTCRLTPFLALSSGLSRVVYLMMVGEKRILEL